MKVLSLITGLQVLLYQELFMEQEGQEANELLETLLQSTFSTQA